MDNNFEHANAENNMNLKRKKKIILSSAIVSVILILAIILSTIAISNYKRNQAAKESFKAIGLKLDNENYVQAYNDIISFKEEYDFGDYPGQADEKLKTLNDLAVKAKNDGLKKLIADRSENFEDTYMYFKNYTVDYSYDANIEQVNNLLKLIEDYTAKNDDLTTAKSSSEWFDSNQGIIDIMESYINDVEALNNIADRCINDKESDLSDDLYNKWDRNSDYYYGMVDDIQALSKDDLNGTMITSDEYKKFEKLIYNGLVPAETYYRIMEGYDVSDDVFQLTRDSWSIYESLYDEMSDILASKKLIISSHYDRLTSLKDEVNNLSKEIKSYSFDENTSF